MPEAINNHIEGVLNTLTTDDVVKSIMCDNSSTSEQTDIYSEIEETLESTNFTVVDNDVKKAIETAILIAQEFGVFPDMTPEQVATLVDEFGTRINIAYGVAIGEIDLTRAAEMAIDRATSRVSALVDIACESGYLQQGVETVTYAVCSFLQCSPEHIIYLEDCVFEQYLPEIKQIIKKGVHMVGEGAKVVAKGLINVGNTALNKIKKFIFA